MSYLTCQVLKVQSQLENTGNLLMDTPPTHTLISKNSPRWPKTALHGLNLSLRSPPRSRLLTTTVHPDLISSFIRLLFSHFSPPPLPPTLPDNDSCDFVVTDRSQSFLIFYLDLIKATIRRSRLAPFLCLLLSCPVAYCSCRFPISLTRDPVRYL